MRSTSKPAYPKQERHEQVAYNFRKVPVSEFTPHIEEFIPLFESAFDNAEEFILLSNLLYQEDLITGAMTGLLRDCKLLDIDQEQFDARVMYFIMAFKDTITSYFSSDMELKQLPYQVITPLLCNPNSLLEKYIKSPQQLIELLQVFPVHSIHLELVIASMRLDWFMSMITTNDQLTHILLSMTEQDQDLFLNSLDQEWLEKITGIRKKNIEMKCSTYFTPSNLKKIFPDENGNKIESYISLHLKEKCEDKKNIPNKKEDQKEKVSLHSLPSNHGVNWNKVGFFALTGTIVLGAAMIVNQFRPK